MSERTAGLGAGARYRRSEKVAWRDVAGEVLLIHPARQSMYPLNRVASRIWTLLDGARDARAVAGEVHRAFEVEEARALKDVLAFLQEMEKDGLIEGAPGVERGA